MWLPINPFKVLSLSEMTSLNALLSLIFWTIVIYLVLYVLLIEILGRKGNNRE